MFVGSPFVGAIAMPVQFSLERINTPTGRMVIVTDEHCLRAVDWEDHEPRMQRLLRRHYGTNAILREVSRPSAARRSLQAYFEGDLNAVTCLPTATNGTEFQWTVWDALRRIPVGQTISYGALAVQIGRPTATRAVGLANGANPIAIVIPCHRVIGAKASLTGYGGGVDRKRWLLAHESACSASLGAQFHPNQVP
jgi:methylated-DNA-[protein]-cysteine S-methyltransferase